jgi:acylaminoacyl-peptidase
MPPLCETEFVAKTSLALLLYAAGAWAAQPWSPGDLWNWRTAADPRISPDGRQVVYLDGWNDRPTGAACANLWLVSTAGAPPLRLTEGPWRDRSPRWSPDSTRIAWISGGGGIHVLQLQPRQEVMLAPAAPGPVALAWSADGQWLAFTAVTPPPSAAPSWAPPEILPWLWPRPAARTAVFAIPSAGGTARPITAPDFDASGEPAWMPDGKSIVTAASDGELYAIRIADATAHRLTENTGRNENPVPSPDGARIAWLATDSRPTSYSIRKLYVMNADGSRAKVLAGALDRDPAHPQWSSDSRTVYFTADDSGSTHVFAARADGTVRQVTRAVERLHAFSLADNGRAVTVRSGEVVTFTVDLPPIPAVLAAPAAPLLAERATGAVEEVDFPSAGRTIQAWIVKPPGFDAAKKYPLLLDIQDAPRRMVGPEFSLRAQIFAARGWLVLRVNPRGTPGYGEEFGRLLPSRFPGDDADDLLAAVDFIVSKGYADPRRLAVSGGLLAAWILGHSDRFAAVVARRAIVDFAPDPRAAAWMGALPWEDPEQYHTHSPLYFAQNWKTPTLVLAADPDPQADEFYSALQQRKVNSALVRIPNAGSPAARILEIETILAWIEKFLPHQTPAPEY